MGNKATGPKAGTSLPASSDTVQSAQFSSTRRPPTALNDGPVGGLALQGTEFSEVESETLVHGICFLAQRDKRREQRSLRRTRPQYLVTNRLNWTNSYMHVIDVQPATKVNGSPSSESPPYIGSISGGADVRGICANLIPSELSNLSTNHLVRKHRETLQENLPRSVPLSYDALAACNRALSDNTIGLNRYNPAVGDVVENCVRPIELQTVRHLSRSKQFRSDGCAVIRGSNENETIPKTVHSGKSASRSRTESVIHSSVCDAGKGPDESDHDWLTYGKYPFENLVLSGGGSKGYAYIGSLKVSQISQ